MNGLRELLLIDEEHPMVNRLVNGLMLDSIHVEQVSTGREGLSQVDKQPWRLVIAGANLSDMTAENLLILLREFKLQYPIMILTDKKVTWRSVRLFRLGANEVISRTEPIEEIMARIWNLFGLQRLQVDDGHTPIRVDDIRIDPSSRTVYVEGDKIMLTATEFDLLYYLARNEGKVLPREQILANVWGYEFAGDSNLVDVYIRYLRLKIDNKYKKKLIRTIRGSGYMFEVDIQKSGSSN